MHQLRFIYDYKRAIQAVNFFARNCPDFDKKKMAKLIFYADKLHLIRHGRTITGDSYNAMWEGPVPSQLFDNTKRNNGFRPEMSYWDKHVVVNGDSISSVGEVDPLRFSKTDLEVLNAIKEKYGKYTADELSEMSHDEKAWLRPWREKGKANNPKMIFEEFFDDPDSEAFKTAQLFSDVAKD